MISYLTGLVLHNSLYSFYLATSGPNAASRSTTCLLLLQQGPWCPVLPFLLLQVEHMKESTVADFKVLQHASV